LKKSNLLIALAVVISLVTVSRIVIAEKTDKASMERAVLKVENLSCGGCFTTINESLKPLEGFAGFGANLLRKLIAVDFVPPLTPETIAKTISDIGYPANIESVNKITKKESFAYIQKKRNTYSGNNGQGQGSCCSTAGAAQTVQTTNSVSQEKTSYNSGGSSCCRQ
jgi:copper chaperone CopZ